MTTLAPAEACADAFEAVRRTAPAPDAVVDLRRRAFERFSALGFPTTRLEAWRFTNVAPIANTAFALATPAEREAAKADTAPHALGIGAGLTVRQRPPRGAGLGRFRAAGRRRGAEPGGGSCRRRERDPGRGRGASGLRRRHRERGVHGAQHRAPPRRRGRAGAGQHRGRAADPVALRHVAAPGRRAGDDPSARAARRRRERAGAGRGELRRRRRPRT